MESEMPTDNDFLAAHIESLKADLSAARRDALDCANREAQAVKDCMALGRELADLRAGMRGECHDSAEEQSGCYRAVKAERELAQARDGALEEARSWSSAMYEDSRKDRYDIMFKQGWEAASEAIEEKIRALKSPAQGATINAYRIGLRV